MKTGPDMVWLVAQVHEQYPAAVIDDRGPREAGGLSVDMRLGDQRVVVQWIEGGGYSVSLVRDGEPRGLPPDKTYKHAADALRRVQHLFARRTVKPEPDARLDVPISADLLRRLKYAAGLPAHQDHGGTFEALVVWALEEGLIGIVLAYERFEDNKPITDALHAELRAHHKPKTRMAAGSKGKRLIHRR